MLKATLGGAEQSHKTVSPNSQTSETTSTWKLSRYQGGSSSPSCVHGNKDYACKVLPRYLHCQGLMPSKRVYSCFILKCFCLTGWKSVSTRSAFQSCQCWCSSEWCRCWCWGGVVEKIEESWKSLSTCLQSRSYFFLIIIFLIFNRVNHSLRMNFQVALMNNNIIYMKSVMSSCKATLIKNNNYNHPVQYSSSSWCRQQRLQSQNKL